MSQPMRNTQENPDQSGAGRAPVVTHKSSPLPSRPSPMFLAELAARRKAAQQSSDSSPSSSTPSVVGGQSA